LHFEEEKNGKEIKCLSRTGENSRPYEEGESLLFGELSIVLGIPITEVQNYIKARINTNKS